MLRFNWSFVLDVTFWAFIVLALFMSGVSLLNYRKRLYQHGYPLHARGVTLLALLLMAVAIGLTAHFLRNAFHYMDLWLG